MIIPETRLVRLNYIILFIIACDLIFRNIYKSRILNAGNITRLLKYNII